VDFILFCSRTIKAVCKVVLPIIKKQSHYRPGQALRFPAGWSSKISRQSAHEGGKVVSPTHRPPLPRRKHSRYSFLLQSEPTPGPERLCQWKIPMTPMGKEPAIFRLVAHCLSQLRQPVPRYRIWHPVILIRIVITLFYVHSELLFKPLTHK
jgi:hypothetical protein